MNINTEEDMLYKDQDDKMLMLHDPSPPKISSNNKVASTSRRAKLQVCLVSSLQSNVIVCVVVYAFSLKLTLISHEI